MIFVVGTYFAHAGADLAGYPPLMRRELSPVTGVARSAVWWLLTSGLAMTPKRRHPPRRSRVHPDVHLDVHLDNARRSTRRREVFRLLITRRPMLSFRLHNLRKIPRICPFPGASRSARSIARIPLPNRHRMCTR